MANIAQSHKLPYNQKLEDVAELTISETFFATIWNIDLGMTSVQLASQIEADKMIYEFTDPDGDSMYDDDAIFSKYEELHKYRP